MEQVKQLVDNICSQDFVKADEMFENLLNDNISQVKKLAYKTLDQD